MSSNLLQAVIPELKRKAERVAKFGLQVQMRRYFKIAQELTSRRLGTKIWVI